VTTRSDWLAAVAADGATLIPDLSVGGGALPDLGPAGISLPVFEGTPAYGAPGPDASWSAVTIDGTTSFRSSNAAAVAWGAPTSFTIEAIIRPTGTVGTGPDSTPFLLSDAIHEETSAVGDGVYSYLRRSGSLFGHGAGISRRGETDGFRVFGGWVHLAATYDATVGELIVTAHGCPSGSEPKGSITWHGSRVISLGAQVHVAAIRPARFFVGDIAGIAYAPVATTVEKLREHATVAGLARSCGGFVVGAVAVG
jgi:hypothetical protein